MRTFEAKTFEPACGRRRAPSQSLARIAMLMQWPSLTILRSANLIQMIDWINPRNTPIAQISLAQISLMKKANPWRDLSSQRIVFR
jgi:hypothetical protein